MNLAPQLWVSRRTPAGAHFQRVVNDQGFGVKPTGGFWTSTYSPETGSAWVEWCLGEDFRVPANWRWHGWLLTPPPDVEVLTIDTYADLCRALEVFGIASPVSTLHAGGKSLDFERLAESFDCIHLTERGQWETRLSMPHTLYGWDCESTLWLNWPWAHGEIIDLGFKTWGAPPPVDTRGRIRRARRDL